MEELEEVGKQGYALDRREHEEGVECVGAPIRDHLGEVIAALSISGPQEKIKTPSEKRFVKEVKHAASQISCKLGYLENLR